MEINGLLCHDGVTKTIRPKLAFDETRDDDAGKGMFTIQTVGNGYIALAIERHGDNH